jgi:hypothetical protein
MRTAIRVLMIAIRVLMIAIRVLIIAIRVLIMAIRVLIMAIRVLETRRLTRHGRAPERIPQRNATPVPVPSRPGPPMRPSRLPQKKARQPRPVGS